MVRVPPGSRRAPRCRGRSAAGPSSRQDAARPRPLEEPAIDLDLLVLAQRVRSEVLGCLDAGDRVIRLVGLVVGPVLQPIRDPGHTAPGSVISLRGAEGKT